MANFVKQVLKEYEKGFTESLPEQRRGKVDFSKNVFPASAFLLCCRQLKKKIDRQQFIQEVDCSGHELEQVMKQMAEICKNVFEQAKLNGVKITFKETKKSKTPKEVKEETPKEIAPKETIPKETVPKETVPIEAENIKQETPQNPTQETNENKKRKRDSPEKKLPRKRLKQAKLFSYFNK